jgi:hypothetical protein
MSRDSLLAGESPLFVTDAAAAIPCVETDGYLMQLRDARPDIWYPDPNQKISIILTIRAWYAISRNLLRWKLF